MTGWSGVSVVLISQGMPHHWTHDVIRPNSPGSCCRLKDKTAACCICREARARRSGSGEWSGGAWLAVNSCIAFVSCRVLLCDIFRFRRGIPIAISPRSHPRHVSLTRWTLRPANLLTIGERISPSFQHPRFYVRKHGGQCKREWFKLNRWRLYNDATLSYHPWTTPEEDWIAFSAEQGFEGGTGDIQIEGEGSSGRKQGSTSSISHHREFLSFIYSPIHIPLDCRPLRLLFEIACQWILYSPSLSCETKRLETEVNLPRVVCGTSYKVMRGTHPFVSFRHYDFLIFRFLLFL